MSEEPNRKLNDEEINNLINRKISADDTDSGWLMAQIVMRVLPVLEDLAQSTARNADATAQMEARLRELADAIAPDEAGVSLGYCIRPLSKHLQDLNHLLEKFIAKGSRVIR